MITPTIAEIKQATLDKSPHFFDRATLKFFGQTMRAFKVKRSPGGRVFIFAPNYDRSGERDRFMGYTLREFIGGDLIVPHDEDGTIPLHSTLAEVLGYISTH